MSGPRFDWKLSTDILCDFVRLGAENYQVIRIIKEGHET